MGLSGMVGFFVRIAIAVAFPLALAACGGASDLQIAAYSPSPGFADSSAPFPGHADTSTAPLQCVPYAREHSGIDIYGDAYTWWGQASGRFDKSSAPIAGGVLVLANYAGPNRAHLAVVRQIDSAREIRVDHANWFNDGEVYVDDPVRDVSPANDWSQVRVFNVRTGTWGGKIYPVQGFIGPNPPAATPPAEQPDDPIATLLMADAGTK